MVKLRSAEATAEYAVNMAHFIRDVRKDLKGRYPRHYWPDDPLVAEPRRTTRKR